jgi:hypothetical protein
LRAASRYAQPALRRAYLEAARNRIDEIDAMIAAEEADGNPDIDVGVLRERSTRIRDDLRNAESLQDRRELYQQTKELQTTTRELLPTTVGERAVEAVLESMFIAIIASVLAVVVLVETYLLIDAYLEKGSERLITTR